MGGETPPEEYLQSLIPLSETLNEGDCLAAFGSSDVLSLTRSTSIEKVVCEQVIEMDDEPRHAIRLKKQSSMVQGLKALKEGKIDAFVSAGNTGSLVTGAALFLGMISPLFARPALIALIPSQKGEGCPSRCGSKY